MESLQSLAPRLLELFGPQFVRVVLSLIVLLVGFLVARSVAWVVTKGLGKTTIDNRLAGWVAGDRAQDVHVEAWVGKIFYYTLLLFTLVLFFNTLELNVVSEPILTLLNKLFGYAPQLLGGAVLTGVAWLLATVARRGMMMAASRWHLDEKLGDEAGIERDKPAPSLGKSLGDGIYYLVFLLFLPSILGVLGLQGLLEPVQSMMDRLLSFLPNVLAAGVILAVGWFVARVVQRIVTNLLAAVGTDNLGERLGLGTALGTRKLSGLLGLVVYVFILFNVLLSSLNALQLEAVTRPASDMLGSILDAIPLLFAAGILLTLAFFVGRVAATLISSVLAGAGFDSILQNLGLARAETVSTEARKPSELAGTLLLAAIMLFASIEAAGLLGFDNLASLLSDLLSFAAQVVLGVVVFGVGLFLANLAAGAIRASASEQAGLLAQFARVAIIGLASAIALRQMGLANEIIELAFGLVLGAFAVAFAIAFGLGGREMATKQLTEWKSKLG